MQFLVLSVLVSVLVLSKAANPKSINLALETVLEFDKASDVEFINQVQRFLKKIKEVIKEDSEQRDIPTRRSQQYKFTDFFEDIIEILSSFRSDDLIKVLKIIHSEIRRKEKNEDLLQKYIRRFLSNGLSKIIVQPPRKLRDNLHYVLRKLKKNKQAKDGYLHEFINSLYKKDSEAKLKKFISRLKIFRRSTIKNNRNLLQTIRKAVRIIIFDHISNLSKSKKRKAHLLFNDYFRVNKRSKSKHLPKSDSEKEHINSEDDAENNVDRGISADTKLFKNDHNRNHNKLFSTRYKANDYKLHAKKKLTHVTLYPKSIEEGKPNLKTRFRVVPSISSVRKSKKNIIADDQTKESSVIQLTSLSHSIEIGVNYINNTKNKIIYETFDHTHTDYRLKTIDSNELESKQSKGRKRSQIFKASVEYFGNLYNTPRYKSKDSIKQTFIDKRKHRTRKDKNYKNNLQNLALVNKGIFKPIDSGEEFKTSTNTYHLLPKVSNRRANELDVRDKMENSSVNTTKCILGKNTSVQNTTNTTIKNRLSTTITNKALHKANIKRITEKSKEIDTHLNTPDAYLKEERDIDFTKINNSPSYVTETNSLINTTTTNEIRAPNTLNTVSFAVSDNPLNIISNIQDVEDVDKRKEIERRMKEDLKNLFAPSVSLGKVPTTEAFTDIFQDLEEKFQLD